MIKVTRFDGSEMYVNDNLIELIEETPDTHITLTNGNRYLVREKASRIIEKIILFRASIQSRAQRGGAKKYHRKRLMERFCSPLIP